LGECVGGRSEGFSPGAGFPSKIFFPVGGGEGRRPSPAVFSSVVSIPGSTSEECQQRNQLHGQRTQPLAKWCVGERGGCSGRGNHGRVRRGDLEVRGEAKRGNGDVGGKGSTHGRTKKRSLFQGRRRAWNYQGGAEGRRRMKEGRAGASVGSDKGERGSGWKGKEG
jgi:hypothetical protein